MSEPPDQSPQPGDPEYDQQRYVDNFPNSPRIRQITVPDQFENYPITFLSSMGRADLMGADPGEQERIRTAMYDGWMRPNEYDSQGNMTYGPRERREARQEYDSLANDISDKYGGNAEFDWRAWEEEYEEGSLNR